MKDRDVWICAICAAAACFLGWLGAWGMATAFVVLAFVAVA